mmetsp:Transcript_42582/g.90091  ORF Transcript_42582/g.90091 Transcript_42582/m.90091 type:complete len:340 (+) Transcript_42582:17-1036(+)
MLRYLSSHQNLYPASRATAPSGLTEPESPPKKCTQFQHLPLDQHALLGHHADLPRRVSCHAGIEGVGNLCVGEGLRHAGHKLALVHKGCQLVQPLVPASIREEKLLTNGRPLSCHILAGKPVLKQGHECPVVLEHVVGLVSSALEGHGVIHVVHCLSWDDRVPVVLVVINHLVRPEALAKLHMLRATGGDDLGSTHCPRQLHADVPGAPGAPQDDSHGPLWGLGKLHRLETSQRHKGQHGSGGQRHLCRRLPHIGCRDGHVLTESPFAAVVGPDLVTHLQPSHAAAHSSHSTSQIPAKDVRIGPSQCKRRLDQLPVHRIYRGPSNLNQHFAGFHSWNWH